MASLAREDVSQVLQLFKDKKAIIIDLRNYPNFIYELFSRYINSEKRDFASIYRPNITYQGKFNVKII
jgi:hypothetical protein